MASVSWAPVLRCSCVPSGQMPFQYLGGWTVLFGICSESPWIWCSVYLPSFAFPSTGLGVHAAYPLHFLFPLPGLHLCSLVNSCSFFRAESRHHFLSEPMVCLPVHAFCSLSFSGSVDSYCISVCSLLGG